MKVHAHARSREPSRNTIGGVSVGAVGWNLFSTLVRPSRGRYAHGRPVRPPAYPPRIGGLLSGVSVGRVPGMIALEGRSIPSVPDDEAPVPVQLVEEDAEAEVVIVDE